MAESNQEPMSIEAFRAKKAASAPSGKSTTASKLSPNSSNPSVSTSTSALTRPASASKTNSARRSMSTENLSGRDAPSLDERQEKVKLLREKQAEDRRRKNEERRAAFEERRRKKEEDEKERWSTLKDQAAKRNVSKPNASASKPGTGRKLPTLPQEGSAMRPGSAVERPSSLPKPLMRPSSATTARSPSRSSADSLSGGSTPKESPATTPGGLQPKKSLGVSKSASASNLNRRGSGGSVPQRPSSGTKPRMRSTSTHSSALTLENQNSKKSTSRESLLPPAGKLAKSHSTSSIHKVGQHRPAADKSHKTETKPKAGVTDEATAKQALAERRKKAREEAERQAALDKERQEAERLKKEEEERIRAEEEAKEEARMRELAELLRKQEEERLRIAAEEKEKQEQEEAERAAAEKKRKEEEEQKMREEEERKAKEDEERRKEEEAARLERKRRVEQIMSRTRQSASPTTTEESNSSAAANQETKDPEDTKRKVSEILQKVKGVSGSQNAMGQMEEDGSSMLLANAEEVQENNNEFDTPGTVNDELESISFSSIDTSNKSTFQPVHTNGVHSSSPQGFYGESTNNGDEVHVSSSSHLITVEQESTYMLTTSRSTSNEHEKETVSFQHSEGPSTIEDYGINGTDQVSETADKLPDTEATATVRHIPETKQGLAEHNPESVNIDLNGVEDEELLWLHIEATMRKRQSHAVETLENLGVVAEGDDDEESEEGQLWKVVEGKAQLAEIV
ncbi:uncharacterized protein LOC144657216 isoform X2 [Oculina patagonica]